MPRHKKQQTEIKQAAKKYVDDQLHVLKNHGSVTHISKGEYNSLVNAVVRVSTKGSRPKRGRFVDSTKS